MENYGKSTGLPGKTMENYEERAMLQLHFAHSLRAFAPLDPDTFIRPTVPPERRNSPCGAKWPSCLRPTRKMRPLNGEVPTEGRLKCGSP